MIFEKTITKIYLSIMDRRMDPVGDIFYFSASDFEGLREEDFEFFGNGGQRLIGRIYRYGDGNDRRIIVFDHGMGNGHDAYLREIELLARHGYTVVSYDHTGCHRSEGESVRGFSQSLSDLDCCLCYVKARFAGSSISVIGHSWGGFSTLNISALHPEITHIVALSGFVSVERMLKQFFSGLLGAFVPKIYAIEKERGGKYAEMDAVSSLRASDAKALIIHSRDDKTVKAKAHFDVLSRELADRPETYFLSLSDRGHNPNYTKNAVKLLGEFNTKLTKARRKKRLATPEEKKAFLDSFDWWAITEQDEEIFSKIFEFLDS